MTGTAFLGNDFELVVEGGERRVRKKRPDGMRPHEQIRNAQHRTDGHRAAQKRWLCKRCWAMYSAKVGICDRCEHTHFEKCDSAGEAQWLIGLVRRLERGEIEKLVLHPVYRLHAMGPGGLVHVRNYNADAEYIENGVVIVADYKPRFNPRARTKAKREIALDPVFLVKRDWFAAEYGRPVTIVTN